MSVVRSQHFRISYNYCFSLG
uniref:Uncharacterized protein n=1 Tax=Arundo donax TaxID=35708 RepID=A0A0A9CHU7_ARUDO